MTDATEPLWLQLARSDLGLKEVAGAAANPRIVQMYAAVGHGECTSDEIAWCAASTGFWLKSAGLPIPPPNVNLLARSYLTHGVPCEPKPGAIAIWPRGKSSWQGHVNIVEKVTPDGKVVCIGGNQSNAVTRTKPQDASAALGFRWPVAATVKELREAGSSDIATADTIKKVAIAAGGVASAGAAANQATAPPAIPTFPDVSITQATEQLSAVKMFMEGTYAVASLVFAHPWLAAGLVVAVGGYVVARKIERTRIRRAELGHALSRAG
jgi:uncharacterized protein (TIGR02594 family)